MERKKWTPEGHERANSDTLFDQLFERATRPVECEAAREIYDGLVSGRLTYEWDWKQALRLAAHVGAFGADCGEHAPDCAYWQPWPPAAPPEEQSRNYPEHRAKQEAAKAEDGESGGTATPDTCG